MAEFHSNSELLEGFIVSVYVLGFAFGPLIIAPMSEMWGRLKLYHSCSFLFLICTIICAVSKNMNMLIVFRFLAGSVGAAPLALGGGTIADLIKREQRAMAMAIWVLGPSTSSLLNLSPIIADKYASCRTCARPRRWRIHLRISRLALELLDHRYCRKSHRSLPITVLTSIRPA